LGDIMRVQCNTLSKGWPISHAILSSSSRTGIAAILG
jgi:hypothetical protein